jgi:hypothetical protein
MSTDPGNGITQIPTHHSVDEVLEKIKLMLNSNHITLFTIIDHSGEAQRRVSKCPTPNSSSLAVPNPALLSCKPLPLVLWIFL